MTSGISEEGVLRKLLQQMNSQLPSKRHRLSELMEMVEPYYEGRDGNRYTVSRDELLAIKKALDELEIMDVKIPIVLMADPGHPQSTWRVEGEDECAVISRVLGREGKEHRDRIFLYGPHVAELRRKLPTTTTCMFLP